MLNLLPKCEGCDILVRQLVAVLHAACSYPEHP